MTPQTEWKNPIATRVTAVLYGVACHLLFALGVGTMIAEMFFGMSHSLGRVASPWNTVANVLLLGQFPVAHSLLLSRVGGRLIKFLAPSAIASPLSTTTYALIASVQVLLLFAFWTPSGIVWWRAEGPSLWLLTSLYIAAWLLLLKAIWDAGMAVQTGFLGWWAIAHNRMPKFPPMPIAGLFAIMRQPIYVAFALTLWTVPTWTPDQLVVALTLTSYCLVGPLLKEARFRRRFGAEFQAYAARTPYWLPWPRPPAKRNDLAIYDADWWDGEIRWVRTLKNLVPARLAFFDKYVSDWRSKSVLDLGSGGGFMAEALAARGSCVTGIDPSSAAILAAQRHAEGAGLPIDYHVGSGELLPFADGSFEIVVCVDVLEHVADLDRVIAEVRRVLRPDGLFLFDTINRTALAAFVMITIGESIIRLLPPGTHDAAMFIRPEELSRKLDIAGFSIEKLAGLGPRGLNSKLDLTFGHHPTLALSYIGAARLVRTSNAQAQRQF